MPSWNIHIAHVEHLFAQIEPESLGIRDANAFLVGNLVPDIYVGFMVPNATHHIDYKLTHLALREQIPLPDHERFWSYWVSSQRTPVSDLTLGAWAHLVADHVYNRRVRALAIERGLKMGNTLRIAKQADFALFGQTLPITFKPHVDGALLEQCARFAPYSIEEEDAHAAVKVTRSIVRENEVSTTVDEDAFDLLDLDFFHAAFQETEQTIFAGLRSRLER